MAGTKRKRDRSGSVDPYAKRRARYRAVLGWLGVGGLFAAMPRRVQELYLQHKSPDPDLTFDPSVPVGGGHDAVRRELEREFAVAEFEVDACYGGGTMTTRDFFAVGLGLRFSLAIPEPKTVFPAVRAFLDAARPAMKALHARHLDDAVRSLYVAACAPLAAHSRLQTRLIFSELRLDHSPMGKQHVRVVVHAADPQVRRVALDGAARPVYRVPATQAGGEVRWLSWTAGQAGRAAGSADLPVFVQSHALRNLERRVNLPGAVPYLQMWLEQSLANPVVVGRGAGGELLVEFRIQAHRLGYLIVTPLAEVAVVRTFKFLTMAGTPESRLIARHLRLRRCDTEWLGLDDLAAFTRSDLRDDPVLRPLLASCGCGHLFDLDESDWTPPPKPLAAEVRRYLGLAA